MIEENGKLDGSSKSAAQSRKTNRFTFLNAEMAYRNNFSKKNVLVESEVLVSDLSDSIFAFIEDIFMKRQWDKLNKEAPTPLVELVREFYTNRDLLILMTTLLLSLLEVKLLNSFFLSL
jgi:hypothetical protein